MNRELLSWLLVELVPMQWTKVMGTSHVAQVAPLPRSPLNDISAPPPVADSDQPHQSPCRCGAGAFIAPYTHLHLYRTHSVRM